MIALARLLRVMASSVVPGGGFLLGEWSPATALALYWIENIVSSLAMAVRIALHRRWTGRAGHDRGQLNATYTVSTGVSSQTLEFKSFLAEFFLTSISFNIAHGIFLAVVLGFIFERPDASALRQGALGVVSLHALALSFDAVRLDQWPFARLKHQALQVMGRVVLVNMAILGGMWFAAWRSTPGAFFSVFVWLKFFSDLGSILPQWEPREPPRWLVRVMSLFPPQKGESFEAYWRRTRSQEEAQAKQDELARRPHRRRRSKRG